MPVATTLFRFVACIAVAIVLCCRALPVTAAETVRVNGSGAPLEMLQVLADAYMRANPDVRIQIDKPLGSSGAIKALLAGALDLVISSKELKPEEKAKGARSHEYGQTPLMIVTGRGGGKGSITTSELEAIFNGNLSKWPSGETLRPILRPEGDIDTIILRKLSPGMDKALTTAHARKGIQVAVTDPETNAALAKTPGSIGTAALSGFERQKLPLNVLALNGIAPTTRNLANGSYPLAKNIHFISSGNTSPAARRFLNFIYSAKGKALAEKHGVAIKAAATP